MFDEPSRHELQQLFGTSIPRQQTELEEGHANLSQVADFCDSNYIQSGNKGVAFEKTKEYLVQCLASVAYQIDRMSKNLLTVFELQSRKVDDLTNQVDTINEFVNVLKEKQARQEIGRLTANKRSVARAKKIEAPVEQDRPERYRRQPIDFTVLDGVGHAPRPAPQADAHMTVRSLGGIPGMHVVHQRHAPLPHMHVGGAVTLGPSAGALYQQQLASGGGGGGVLPSPAGGETLYAGMERTANIGATLSRASTLRASGLTNGAASLDGRSLPMAAQTPLYAGYRSQAGYSQAGSQYSSGSHDFGVGRGSTSSGGDRVGGAGAGAPLATPSEFGADSSSIAFDRQSVRTVQDRHSPLPTSEMMAARYQPQHDGNGFPPPGASLLNSSHDDDQPLPPPPPPLAAHHFLQHNTVDSAQMGGYLDKCVVVYDYNAAKSDELTLREGQVVYVVARNDDGWWEGVLDGVTGLFPCNYVDRLPQGTSQPL